MTNNAHDDPEFLAMCREHGIEGTAMVALCGVFWNRTLATHAAAEPVACKAEQSRWGTHLYLCDGKDCGNCTRNATFASAPAEPDMRAICEALGFDPTNHHNAAKCPYCRPTKTPPAAGAARAVASEVDLIEKAAVRVGMKSLMNHGAASCVYTEGCNGVSQSHLIAFAREVALHCVAAMAPAPDCMTLETGKGDARC